MSIRTHSCRFDGLATDPVIVEAKLMNGFSHFTIVGYAGTSVKESRERVRASLEACGIRLPPGRILINLYPGDLQKGGTQWDLPIAVTLCAAMKRIPASGLEHLAFLGELSLEGVCRSVPGLFSMLMALKAKGIRDIYIPAEALSVCRNISGLRLHPCHSLAEVLHDLDGSLPIQPIEGRAPIESHVWNQAEDYSDLIGHATLKRVMTIAAAGKHSVLLIGPPGAGKSMALQRFPGILPELSEEEAEIVARLHSLVGDTTQISRRPPFRKPHESCTPRAFFGGGVPPLPGELSLAHLGVLFLDELSQFSPICLNGLRRPMETGTILLARGRYQLEAPADFQLIAATNPCACGYAGDPDHLCQCTPSQIRRFRQKISGPLLDRFDLILEVGRESRRDDSVHQPKPSSSHGFSTQKPLSESQIMKQQVGQARKIQLFRNPHGILNGRIPETEPDLTFSPTDAALTHLSQLERQFHLSRRTIRHILRVARTIADLNEVEQIDSDSIDEAYQYQSGINRWFQKEIL